MSSQTQAQIAESSQQAALPRLPYPPSFINRLMDSVKRLPIPYWLTYLLLILLQTGLSHVLSWLDGWLPAFSLNPILFVFPVWLWFPLAIMTHLDSVARQALASFRSLLDVDEAEISRLSYEFTTLPNRSVIISGIFWSVIYFIIVYGVFQAFFVANGVGIPATVFIIVEGLLSFIVGGTIYYHSIRQLRLVNRTVKMVDNFNLFQLDPVYAFSRVTAQTGIAWMILLFFTLLSFPIQLAPMPIFAFLTVQTGLALAAFVLPLWFVHHRLFVEKHKLLSELNQHLESTIAVLHRNLDQNELGDMIQLNNALTGLNTERDMLAKIPTWPWRAGTLTGFLSAIILPIVLFLIQLVLGKILGG
jgi:hypothetical protein